MRTVSLNQYFGAKNTPPLVSTFDLIDASRKGLSKKAIAALAKNLRITQAELLVILNISTRTWQRYSDEKLMPQEVTEKALQLATLYKQGEEVFGSPEKFSGWMNHPSLFFRGKRPIELLDTTFGFQAIHEELIRIDYGVLA
ncbi:MAG: DUF2384 domain-containing protein [Rudanella sp.]|nr:DUF2384 domain-containing protein [Rudanella sp.]